MASNIPIPAYKVGDCVEVLTGMIYSGFVTYAEYDYGSLDNDSCWTYRVEYQIGSRSGGIITVDPLVCEEDIVRISTEIDIFGYSLLSDAAKDIL